MELCVVLSDTCMTILMKLFAYLIGVEDEKCLLMDVTLLSPYIRTANMKHQTKIVLKTKQGTIVLTHSLPVYLFILHLIKANEG